jgi:hypothetical protein
MTNNLVACLGLLAALAIFFGFIALMRYLSYKETLALAERGLTRPEQAAGRGLFYWGLGITGLGLALSLGLYAIGFAAGESYPLHLGPWMLGGFVPLFLGLSLILIYFLNEK